MTCAKLQVKCTIITEDNLVFVGTNGCANPQAVCPRVKGEDYTKCRTICGQEGHAETVALARAGDKAKGARAYVEGHTYACRACQEALFAAGVVSISVGEPVMSPESRIARLKRAVKLNHEWQLAQDDQEFKLEDGSTITLNMAAEYCDSSLYEANTAALAL